MACSRAQARAASGGGAGAPRQARHEQGVEQGEARLPSGRGVEPLLELRGLAAEHVAEVDGESAAERVERHAEQGARRERRQVDLDAAGAALEARERRPVVDGRDEGAEAPALDLERAAEVEDQAHAVLRELGAADGRGRALLVARVPQDGPAEQRMGRALVHAAHHPA